MNSLDLDRAFKEIDGNLKRTRIFIAGCSRSGTTLLQCMMKCFDDTHVEIMEYPVSYFTHLKNDQKTHVLKRTYRCWETLHRIPRSVKIIYVVRHPYDVLTSHHPNFEEKYFTSLERWIDEFNAFEKLTKVRPMQEDLFVVRYEDLVTQPNNIQQRISEMWKLRSIAPFDQFHELIASLNLNTQEITQLNALSGLRPPDPSSLCRWRQDNENYEYIQELINDSPRKISRFIKRFGYERGHFNFPAKPLSSLKSREVRDLSYVYRKMLNKLIKRGSKFILVDYNWSEVEPLQGRSCIPFLEKDGQYWGRPADDRTAILELERLKHSGASFIVFPWTTFWWLDYYSEFHRYLRSNFRCVIENDRVVVFDLRP